MMIPLEHMEMRWRARLDDGRWTVVTDEHTPWCVCDIPFGLPNDEIGNLTALAICKEHNASLKARKDSQ